MQNEQNSSKNISAKANNQVDLNCIILQNQVKSEINEILSQTQQENDLINFPEGDETKLIPRPQTKELLQLIEETKNKRIQFWNEQGEKYLEQFDIAQHIPEEDQNQYKKLLLEFKDVMACSISCLKPGVQFWMVHLCYNVSNAQQVTPMRPSIYQRTAMARISKMFLDASIIAPCTTPVYSRAFCLQKTALYNTLQKLYDCPDNKIPGILRFIIDMHKLNPFVKDFKSELPHVSEILGSIQQEDFTVTFNFFVYFY